MHWQQPSQMRPAVPRTRQGTHREKIEESVARASTWLFAVVGIFMAACDGNGESPTGPTIHEPPRVVAVTVQPVTARMAVGETRQFSATATFSDGSTQSSGITWTSGDESVARVSASGLVTGVSDGSANVQATASGLSGSASVTVETPPFSGAWAMITAGGLGAAHTCALDTNGRAFCWGTGGVGQLGDGVKDAFHRSLLPAPVAGGRQYTSISAGAKHTCALTPAGEAYCWGGLPGDIAEVPTRVPDPSSGSVTWSSIQAGLFYTCGITTTEHLYCWGQNNVSQLGIDPAQARIDVPTRVSQWFGYPSGSALQGPFPLERVKSVAVSKDNDPHTCATFDDGGTRRLACWGGNDRAQTAIGGPSASVDYPAHTTWDVEAVSVGLGTTCVIGDASDRFCLGWATGGRLGIGDVPLDVFFLPTWQGLNDGIQWESIEIGMFHACGLSTAGQAYCWGEGSDGEIGDGVSRPGKFVKVPAPVANPAPFAGLSVGRKHTCAVTGDGRAYCWGHNSSGELGTADTSDALAPRLVKNPGL